MKTGWATQFAGAYPEKISNIFDFCQSRRFRPRKAVRGRGESYSDVIVRLAKGDGGEE
jgi:hypothetical protein